MNLNEVRDLKKTNSPDISESEKKQIKPVSEMESKLIIIRV